MVKIINEISDLLEFKKSNTYDFREFDTVIIKFDFSTKCTIKANRIVCCDLTVPYVSCTGIYSIGYIVCYAIKATTIVCQNLSSTHIRSRNIQAIVIIGSINITAYNICCDCISSLKITCTILNCLDCFTNDLNAREQNIKHLHSFDEWGI